MSKIDELIIDLCPHGVEYTNLGSITSESTVRNRERIVLDVRSVTNSAGLVKTNDFFENTRTSADTSNYKIVESNMIVYNPSRINVGSIARHLEKSNVIVSPMYVVVSIDDKKIDPAYLDLFLSSQQGKQQILSKVEVGARFRLTYQSFARIRLPLPALEIQKEIVSILNKFSQLDAELSAELYARRIQREYYRNHLLGFDNTELPRLKLGDVAVYSKSRIASNELDHTNYVGVDNLLQNRQGKADSSYVPSTGNMTCYESGDVLIGNIRPYLKKIWHANTIGGTNGDVLVIHIKEEYKNKLKSRYLYHLLASDNFFTFNMQNAKGVKMPRGNKDSIMRFETPIPAVDEQERIILILDTFDRLIHSITEGLPAEIKARRQQYEYYRTKLFTFQELAI